VKSLTSTDVAVCVADRAVGDPTFAAVRDASSADPSELPPPAVLAPFQQRLLGLVRECGGPH
jgi:hypothetical protein